MDSRSDVVKARRAWQLGFWCLRLGVLRQRQDLFCDRTAWGAVLIVLCSLLGLSGALTAAQIQGRVTDDASGAWLEGARLDFDLLVDGQPDGVAEYQADADLFGRYRVREVADGDYRVTAQLRGYEPHEGDISITADVSYSHDIAMVKRDPVELFPLWFQVNCVKTGRPLAGMTVKAGRYSQVGDELQEEFVAATDEAGHVELLNMQAGFYRFDINPTGGGHIAGWESYATAGRSELKQAHVVNVQLKPVEQSIEVTVRGYDPVAEQENVPLGKVTVEATALGWDNNGQLNKQLLPTITAGSRSAGVEGDAAAGKVWFNSLCPADSWRLRGKRLGYDMAEKWVTCDSMSGLLDEQAVELSMVLHATELLVVLTPPAYYPQDAFVGTTVHLEGLQDTETEGISRDVEAELSEVTGRPALVAVFTMLLPGSYEITYRQTISPTVDVLTNDSGSILLDYDAEFSGSLFADAVDDRVTTVDLSLVATPVRAFFTLQVAERVVDFPEWRGTEFSFPGREFLPRAGQQVKVLMSEYMVPADTRVALPEFVAETDGDGRFAVTVPPGLYGVRIDDMPDYWGTQTLRSSRPTGQDGAKWEGSEWEEAWPYAGRWPHSGKELMQWPNTYHFGAGGMGLSSRREYNTILRVGTRNMPFFKYTIQDYINSPFTRVVTGIENPEEMSYCDYFMSVMQGPAVLSMSLQSSRAQFSASVELNNGGKPQASFRDIPPGRYALSLQHGSLAFAPDFDHDDLLIYHCPPPGHVPETPLPDCEAEGVMVRYPYEYWQNDTLYLSYPQADKYRDVDVYFWNAEEQFYSHTGSSGRFVLMQSPDFGSLWFPFELGRHYLYLPKDRPYSLFVFTHNLADNPCWLRMDSANIKFEDESPTFYVGGLANNCAVVTAPQHVHTLHLQAWSNESVPEEISGATVEFWDEDVPDMVTPREAANQTAAQYGVDTVTHPNWLYCHSHSVTQSLGASAFEVYVRVYMRRGLRLRVEVLNDLTNQPLSDARLSTRYVNDVAVVTNPPNHVDGWEHIFDFEQPFDAAEPLLLRVEADGYIPQVVELNPAQATADPDNPKNRAYMLVEDQAVRLTPLPGPELSHATLDRAGGFLPGVKKGGGADGYDPAAVKDALTLTWSVKAAPRTHEFPPEKPGDPPRQIRDDIVELWLVDQRIFAKNFYNDAPAALSVPVNGGVREPGVAYSLDQPEMGWIYLQRGVLAADRKVLYQRVRDFVPAADGTVDVTRTLFLPDMPPGLFTPAIIVVSRLGAQTFYEFDYRGDAAVTQLVGSRLPPWMSMLANVFGTVANAQALSQDAGLERFLPEGFMSPLPEFTAAISTEESYLTYDYGLAITMSEGADTPGEGLLGMAQAAMGLELAAALEAGFAGREREFSLGVSGSIGKESLDPNDYCPWIADFIGVKPSLDPGPKGTLGTLFSESFVADNIPHQKRVQHSLSGQTGMKLTVDLTSSLNAIPVVGPVVRKLGKYVDIGCEGSMSGLTGLKVTREWTTTYPQRKEVGPPYVGEKPARRHFLGGAEGDNAQTTFDLAFNFGVGLEVSASSRAGASGSIALTGEEGWTGEPALAIASNPLGTWPVIKRLDGKVQANLEAHVDYWIDSYEKEWSWDLLEIKYEYGTETAFQLAPVVVQSRHKSRNDLAPAETLDARPQLFRGIISNAGLCTAGPAFAFIDMETLGGRQVLRLGFRDGVDAYREPVVVPGSETTGAIAALALAPIPGGGWLLVWSVVAEADLDNHLAPTDIWSLALAADLTVSVPAEKIGTGDLPVTAILCASMGDDVACVLALAKDGVDGQRFRLQGFLRNSASGLWGALQLLCEEFEAVAMGMVGAPETTPAHIAVITPGRALRTMTWDGAVAGDFLELESDGSCGRALCGVLSGSSQLLVVAGAAGGVRTLALGAMGWVSRGDVLLDEHLSELCAVPALAGDGLFVAWTSGGGNSTLRYATLAANGQQASAAKALSGNPHGAYKTPHVEQALAGGYCVSALYEDDGLREYRSFDIDPVTLAIANDDRDGDGMQDHLELHAVDDNQEDALTSVDHILPQEDYDGDGISNYDEYKLIDPPVLMRLWVDCGPAGVQELRFAEAGDALVGLDDYDVMATTTGFIVAPAFFVNSAITDPAGQCLTSDYRPVATTTRWRVVVTAVPADSLAFNWDVSPADPARGLYLQRLDNDRAEGLAVDMKTTATTVFAGGSRVEFEIAYAPIEQIERLLDQGWNLLGSPLMTPIPLAASIAEGRRSAGALDLWNWFDGRYWRVDLAGAMSPEYGHWLYSEYQTGVAFVGIPADGLLLLQPGWNLVSPVSDCALPIQPGMAPGAWHRDASGAYRLIGTAELLKAGECYWLFVTGQQPVSIDLGGNNAGR